MTNLRNMSNIGENIKRYRDLRQYSQEYMAVQLNITQSSYAKLERMETKLTIDRLQQIAEILDVDLSLLLNSTAPTVFNLFDNQTANGKVEHLYHNLPDQLVSQYESQITQLKEEISFLRSLISRGNQ